MSKNACFFCFFLFFIVLFFFVLTFFKFLTSSLYFHLTQAHSLFLFLPLTQASTLSFPLLHNHTLSLFPSHTYTLFVFSLSPICSLFFPLTLKHTLFSSLPLSHRPFNDWLPLASPPGRVSSGVWFVHVQIKLSYLLQAIELPPVIASSLPVAVSKLRRTNSQPYLQTQVGFHNNHNQINSASMLDLFGPSSSTAFSSSLPTPKIIPHSQSTLNFPLNLSESFFGINSTSASSKKEKDKTR